MVFNHALRIISLQNVYFYRYLSTRFFIEINPTEEKEKWTKKIQQIEQPSLQSGFV